MSRLRYWPAYFCWTIRDLKDGYSQERGALIINLCCRAGTRCARPILGSDSTQLGLMRNGRLRSGHSWVISQRLVDASGTGFVVKRYSYNWMDSVWRNSFPLIMQGCGDHNKESQGD